MLMEAEVIWFLIIGTGIVLGLSFLFIIGLWRITKHPAYGWFFTNLATLSLGIYLWLSVLRPHIVPSGYLAE